MLRVRDSGCNNTVVVKMN